MRALHVVGLCACFMLLACTSASSNDELFIDAIYKNSGQAKPTSESAPHGIHIERTTFKLKEASFCPYNDDTDFFGEYGIWTSQLSCPASRSDDQMLNPVGLDIVGRCHIQFTDSDTYYDMELPTPDPNVAIYATFTATCKLQGDKECGPDCDFVGTVNGEVYEVYDAYTPDGLDPTDVKNLPAQVCDAYDNKKRRRRTRPHGKSHSDKTRKHRTKEPAGQKAQPHSDKSSAQAVAAYYDVDGHHTPLNETVYYGEALVFTGYMNVASLHGDVLPALGGWFEYWSAWGESYWDPIPSAQLPSTARKIEPYTYTFQLWKPAADYEYQRQ